MYRFWLIVALLFCSYAYVLPRWSDWNQNSRLNLVLALVDDGSPRIDRYVENTGDYAIYNGHAYTDKPPGLSFLGVPIYVMMRPLLDAPPIRTQLERIGARFEKTLNPEGSGLRIDKIRFALIQYALTLVLVALPSALFGGLFFLVLRRLGVAPIPASVGTLAYGLATSAAPYAGNFYAHQLVAVLLFTAFVLSWSPPSGWSPVVSGVVVGLLLGWAVISEYPTAPAAAVIGLYAVYRHGLRWLVSLALGGSFPIALLVMYDLAAFGTPWPIGYAYSALWQEQHHTGFISLVGPQWEAIWGLTFSDFRGLFFRAPWLLLAIPAYWIGWRQRTHRAEWWVLLLVPLSFLLFYGSSIMWWGGFAAGPRYIVPMIPFLALLAMLFIASVWSHPGWCTGILILMASSFGLIWMEATATQLFPTDSIRSPWSDYVIPAWRRGDIARNLGMVLQLEGPWSLAPLLLLITTGVIVLFRSLPGDRPTATTMQPTLVSLPIVPPQG